MNRRQKIQVSGLIALASVLGYGITVVKDAVVKTFSEARVGSHFVKEGTYNGYATTIGVDNNGRGICINDGDFRISAKDFQNDGRFDEIYLNNVPKEHALESLASATELEKAYETVNNQK